MDIICSLCEEPSYSPMDFFSAFEVPLTKKLNNFKAVQTGTTNLSDFSKNLSGNLKFIS